METASLGPETTSDKLGSLAKPSYLFGNPGFFSRFQSFESGLFRGFRYMHARMMAALQADIESLEKELEELEARDNGILALNEQNTTNELDWKSSMRLRKTMKARWDEWMMKSQPEAHAYCRSENGRHNALGLRLDSSCTLGAPLVEQACYGEIQHWHAGHEGSPSKAITSLVDSMPAWPTNRNQFARGEKHGPEHFENRIRSVSFQWLSIPRINFQLTVLLLFSNSIGKVTAEDILGLNRNIVSETLSYFGDLIGPAAVVATFLFGAAILFIIAFCVSAKKGPPRKIAFVAGVASVSWWLMELVDKDDESQKAVAGWVSALLWAVLLSLCAKGLDESDHFMFETLCSGGLMVMGMVFLIVAVKVLQGVPLDHNALRMTLSFGLPPLNAWTWFQFKRHLSREDLKYHSSSRGGSLGDVYALSSALEAQTAHARNHCLTSAERVHIAPLAIRDAFERGGHAL